ncbi:hypothetical protein [Paenibacillus fonticola]|uniref:hypothetical protein n=1 Tax=Paenibacillus fonticola TaxID=379896 RepID=UPI0003680737|nr:hypothetical protein [Paenibacillus fonticola]
MPLSAFAEEWKRNNGIGLWLADEGYRLWLNSNRNRAERPSDRTAEKGRLAPMVVQASKSGITGIWS